MVKEHKQYGQVYMITNVINGKQYVRRSARGEVKKPKELNFKCLS